MITKKEDIDAHIDAFDADLYVVKAQIHAGGRGKGGGVKLAKTKDEAKKLAHEIFGMQLVTHQTGPEGQQVRRLYIESGCGIDHEYYLAFVLDRSNQRVNIIASTEGGVDIEEVAEQNPEKIITTSIDPATGIQSFHIAKIALGLDLTKEQQKQLKNILANMYLAFMSSDALTN